MALSIGRMAARARSLSARLGTASVNFAPTARALASSLAATAFSSAAVAVSISGSSSAACETTTSAQKFRSSLLSLRPSLFANAASASETRSLAAAKLVIFGEVHTAAPCIEMQRRTAETMLAEEGSGKLFIVLEQCNFEQQGLLDAYADGRLTMAELVAAYNQGTEGADLAAYEPLLQLARDQPERVALHSGFIPRPYARRVLRESTEAALAAAKADGYVSPAEDCAGTDAHYNFFESLLTKRSVHSGIPPSDRFRETMFPAQVLKDAAMAHKVAALLATSAERDKVLVVTGVGHSGFSHGVPERILKAHPQVDGRMYRIWSLQLGQTVDLDDPQSVADALTDVFGPAGTSDPADLCLVFRESAAATASTAAVTATGTGTGGATAAPSGEQRGSGGTSGAKAATRDAYDQVGATAHLTGNAIRARAVLRRMGYAESEIAVAGDDGYNWQGVGCPHRHAHIRAGEAVLDMGSGLGIDSFIAADAVGDSGRVIGVDIAAAEVRHANARAAARGLGASGGSSSSTTAGSGTTAAAAASAAARAAFEVADFERLPMGGAQFDVVISNGAFCLAPDKYAAFKEAARVLKPGGRIAICLSVLRHKTLPEGVEWPLCMQMFMPLEELKPIVEAAGLTDVRIDSSDALMAFEIDDPSPEAAESANNQRRNKVHVGSKEFEHLKNFDMNELCARVVVTGRRAE